MKEKVRNAIRLVRMKSQFANYVDHFRQGPIKTRQRARGEHTKLLPISGDGPTKSYQLID